MEQIKALNVAIVGGGPGCKAMIDMIFVEKLSRHRMNLIGIACTNPEAEGYRYAQEKGIYTTEDHRDLYKLKDLDMIIELTGRDEVANEISRTKPDHVRLIDHVTAHLFWNVFRVEPESVAALKWAEEKYKTLIENSLTGIFIHQDGKYVFVNDRFAEIHDYTPSELLGKEFLTLIHPDEREVLGHVSSRRLMGEDMPQRYEVRRLGKDGKTIWCEMMATRIEYRGRPAIMGNIIDISERKQALAAVQQRDETLSGIISSVTDHMTMLDDKHNIVWANNVAKRLFGPDLVGKKCYSSYHGREKICEPCIVRQCFEDGKVHQFETDIIVPNGNQRTFWCTASVAGWHRDGRPKLVVEISRDITERKQAEEALIKSFRQLQVAYDQSIIYAMELKEEMKERKRAEEALRKSEDKLDAMLRSIGDHMSMMDKDLNIIWANETAKNVFGNDIIGKKCFEAYHRRKEPCEPYPCLTLKAFQDGQIHEHDTRVIGKDGRIIHFHCTANVALRDNKGRPAAVIEISRDITDSKHAEEALLKRKEELKAQARNLEEMNTAMKVLLKQREEDKAELEEKVVTNVKELVFPYVEALKKTRLGAEQVAYASIIESHLNEIISPFLRKLSSKHRGLTPKEIQVADLIREGKTTKEIAELLNASVRAVGFHRENIRAKLGLKNKRANLRSYLLSLQ